MRPSSFLQPVLSPFLTAILAAALQACATTPTGPPEELAPQIVTLLDEKKTAEADELFDAGSNGEARELLYPLLFEAARSRYESGEADRAAGVLRFMSKHYPKSRSVQEALVYSLFLQRSGLEVASPELVKELGTALEELRAGGSEMPSWVDLVQAQQAIDHGQLPAARDALARFLRTRKEMPGELTIYVEDIERYLSSHEGTTP